MRKETCGSLVKLGKQTKQKINEGEMGCHDDGEGDSIRGWWVLKKNKKR